MPEPPPELEVVAVVADAGGGFGDDDDDDATRADSETGFGGLSVSARVATGGDAKRGCGDWRRNPGENRALAACTRLESTTDRGSSSSDDDDD